LSSAFQTTSIARWSRSCRRGTSYAFYPANAGKYLNAETAGQQGFYHGEYVRTSNGWRMRARRHELTPAVGGMIPLTGDVRFSAADRLSAAEADASTH
jgi:hypothetical protein